MEHSSADGSHNSLRFLFCVETPLRFHRNHVIYPITVVAFLSITAFVGNVFILIALNKISSIHPPSKLLFRCLAVTDILVALVVEPLHAVYLFSIRTMTEEGNIVCLYTATFSITIATTLCGVSPLHISSHQFGSTYGFGVRTPLQTCCNIQTNLFSGDWLMGTWHHLDRCVLLGIYSQQKYDLHRFSSIGLLCHSVWCRLHQDSPYTSQSWNSNCESFTSSILTKHFAFKKSCL